MTQQPFSLADTLPVATRELHKQFEEMISPHRMELWRYCRSMTGSTWDGEDLFQETLLKAFAALPQLWQPVVPRTYLFRIASNTWIDQCRKRKVVLDEWEDDMSVAPPEIDRLELVDALEELYLALPPKQLVIVLLLDVFSFTAAEVSSMIHLTESTLYTTLHRARKRLKKWRENRSKSTDELVFKKNQETTSDSHIHLLIKALQSGDPSQVVAFMSEHMNNDASPGFQEFNQQDMFQGSMRGFAECTLQASVRTLWEREVLVVLAQTEQGWQLHDISYQEFDQGKMVRHKSFYFCRELMEEASRVLQIPLQLQKPAVSWG